LIRKYQYHAIVQTSSNSTVVSKRFRVGMKLRRRHRPNSSRGELGALLGLLAAIAILFAHGDDAISSVLKMPKPLPDIIKNYKSVTIYSGRPGMHRTGMEVKQGDYITILAKGSINVWPAKGKEYQYGPKALLVFLLGENDLMKQYRGPELIEIKESGGIYLGYRGSQMSSHGKPLNPDHFNDDMGSLSVDIIVWKTSDPKLMTEFLEKASSAQPKDEDLREIVQEFKWQRSVLLALQKKKKEVEEIEKELSKMESKSVEAKPVTTSPTKEQITESKKPEREKPIPEQKVAKKVEEKLVLPVAQKSAEEKTSAIPPKAGETPVMKESEREKNIEELTEKLQKALQAMKELEEMKKKMTEKEEKESQLLARLESLEEERSRQAKNLPVIAVAYPKDGLTLDSEYVNLYGMAEHEKGIMRFEILVNKKLVVSKGQRDLPTLPKDRNRIEFSERIRLQEGQNTISIYVQGTGGLTSQKNISIQLAKKREKVFGVVIGINKYKNFPSLKYAVNDAREFYRYLTEANQVPKDHVWLILDEEATLDKFRSTLGTLLRRSAGKDDTVIIFLAGHGATEQDPSSPDGDGLEKYILPHNADPKDLYASALPMSEVARIFQRISSERLVFIGDTCYSGASGGRTIFTAGTRANVSGAFLERLSQGKGRVIITASDANEVSVEKDELKHGVFTYYLLEGLRGKADLDGDGVITIDELYRYVSTKVPPATGQNQHPVMKGETTGQIVLGVAK